MGGEPLPGGVAMGTDETAVGHEVDGQPLLVHRRTGKRSRGMAVVRRLLIDGVVAAAAVGPTNGELLIRIPVALSGEDETVGLRGAEHLVQLGSNRAVDRYPSYRRERDVPGAAHRHGLGGVARRDR